MPELLQAVRLKGVRLDSLGTYLAALGLLEACSRKWTDFRGLWSDDEFVVGCAGLTSVALGEFLVNEWQPTEYERWWKGSKEIARLRSWEPSLARVKLLDAHIVAKGSSNVYNDILGTGGNVGKRDFAKVSEVCRELIRKPLSEAWLRYSLFGASAHDNGPLALPDLPSTGTWFASANKAFNSGYDAAREGQLSPWSYLLALEGAILLRGGSGKRLSARATRYATFPFVSEAAAPEAAGEMESERSEFWAPIWHKPATILEVKALLRRGQARVGNRAARAPFDFAAAALTSGVQAGLARFERFGLRQTTSANTYEAIGAGSAIVTAGDSLNRATIRIADWVDSLPRDKSSAQQSVFYGLRAPVERALVGLAQKRGPERWRDLLFAIARTQRRVDQNQNWRTAQAISQLPAALFDHGWPDALLPEAEIARSISSLLPREYGLRHNIFGLNRASEGQKELFADPRPASAIWHDGDPVRLLADVLERRLIDAEPTEGRAPLPPLRCRQFCSPETLDRFAKGELDPGAVTDLLPAVSLIDWRRAEERQMAKELPPASPEFLVQGYFRPLFMTRLIRLRKGADAIAPDALRALSLVKMIRGGMWRQAFALAERVYLSSGIGVVRPPEDISVPGDRIAACLLIPLELAVTRATFRRWMTQSKKGRT
jgi:CRISPR-associated protein Csx17